MNLYRQLRRVPGSFALVTAILLVVQIGLIDWLTGREVSFSIFYLLPAILVGWKCGPWQRLGIYLMAGVTGFVADILVQRYSQLWIGYWNAFVRFGIFVVAGELAAFVSRRNAELEKEVAERQSAEVKLRNLADTLEEKVVERSAAAEARSLELARSEQRLREQTKILESVLNSMGDGVIVADSSGKILLCNPEAKRVLALHDDDLTVEQWTARQRTILTQPEVEFTEESVHPFSKAVRGEVIDAMETLVQTDLNASPQWVRFTARPLTDEDQAVRGCVIVLSDLTAEKFVDKQIAEVSDREQRRIGQDLHDGVCQHFVSTSLACNMLAENLAQKGLPESAQAIEITNLIKQGITQARDLARILHPVQLTVDGVMFAFEDLVQNVRTLANIDCEFKCPQPISIKDDVTATNLYRIAQEATNNAIKHSGATTIQITLTRQAGWLRLSVTDDGAGFCLSTCRQGMGLPIMKARASAIGATFDVHSVAERGTIVSCALRYS